RRPVRVSRRPRGVQRHVHRPRHGCRELRPLRPPVHPRRHLRLGQLRVPGRPRAVQRRVHRHREQSAKLRSLRQLLHSGRRVYVRPLRLPLGADRVQQPVRRHRHRRQKLRALWPRVSDGAGVPRRPVRLSRRVHDRGRIPARWLLGIAGLALALDLVGIGWGLPHPTGDWATDSLSPLGPLAFTWHFLHGEKWWGKYPPFHMLLLAAVQAPYVAWLKLRGEIGAITAVYPYGLAQPLVALGWLALL